MEEAKKLPLKRVELSLTKFNEVAIPHHLDLLRQHKANIIKYEQMGELSKVRSEQTNARRVAAQLRSLLRELESLRVQVRETDLVAFDKMTQGPRDLTLRAIMDYLGSAPVSMSGSCHAEATVSSPVCCSAVSTESVGLVAHTEPHSQEDLSALTQLQLEKESTSLSEREAVLKGWTELQEEVRELRDVWQQVHETAVRQREHVVRSSASVETADVQVAEARNTLASAERLRSAWYPMAGLVLGGVVGGPIGLVIGAKAAAAAALAGSVLGYTGVSTLVRRRRQQDDEVKSDRQE